MIDKLRRKFVLVAMVSLAALLLVILGGINILNYQKVVDDADEVLAILVENGGRFADKSVDKKRNIDAFGEQEFADKAFVNDVLEGEVSEDNADRDAAFGGETDRIGAFDGTMLEGKTDRIEEFDGETLDGEMLQDRVFDGEASENGMFYGDIQTGLKGGRLSREVKFQSRFFTVRIDSNGQVKNIDLENIATVDEQQARAWGLEVWSSGSQSGFIDIYRYARSSSDNEDLIVFLDCESSMLNLNASIAYSILAALIGLAVVCVVLIALSKRIVAPVAESYEKQRRFITDAGHELKTPITIIGADVDLAEMELGSNEWLSDIRQQAQRLAGLTSDLTYLAHMDEGRAELQAVEFPLSDMVEEMAQGFSSLASTQGKVLDVSVQPMLSYEGDEKALRQLVSILLENAFKYSPEGSRVAVGLAQRGKSLQLTVTNETAEPIDPEALRHLFDRFYRADKSRSSEVEGYGLGLSIAQSIVEAHDGKIEVSSSDGHSLTMTVTL